MGPRAGDVVAVRLGPGEQVVRTLHALWDVGAVPAVLDPRWAERETHAAMEALRPAWMASPELVATGVTTPRFAPDGGGGPDRPAAIIWTSGSSGVARAIVLSAANLDANAAATAARLQLKTSDRWALTLSAAHVGGIALIWRARWVGCAVVADGVFHADTLVDRLSRQELTHASLVPVMLRRLLAHPRLPAETGLRAVLIGGAHAPPELIAEAQARGIPVSPTYGMTETSSQIATATPEMARLKPGSVGPPLDGVEVAIRDGEVVVRGPTLARKFARDGGADGLFSVPLTAEGGWFATGDLGTLDADGHLSITGRKSDRIVSGGVTIDPAEVEAALLRLDEVADAVVVSVADPEWGERVAALLVPASTQRPDAGSLKTRLCHDLSAAKLPRRVVWIDQIPRNANGKADREAVRRAVEGSRSTTSSHLSDRRST